ncbi:MAG: hypothetical protein ACEPOW_13170 [Bacteroidales bacterium]
MKKLLLLFSFTLVVIFLPLSCNKDDITGKTPINNEDGNPFPNANPYFPEKKLQLRELWCNNKGLFQFNYDITETVLISIQNIQNNKELELIYDEKKNCVKTKYHWRTEEKIFMEYITNFTYKDQGNDILIVTAESKSYKRGKIAVDDFFHHCIKKTTYNKLRPQKSEYKEYYEKAKFNTFTEEYTWSDNKKCTVETKDLKGNIIHRRTLEFDDKQNPFPYVCTHEIFAQSFPLFSSERNPVYIMDQDFSYDRSELSFDYGFIYNKLNYPVRMIQRSNQENQQEKTYSFIYQ